MLTGIKRLTRKLLAAKSKKIAFKAQSRRRATRVTYSKKIIALLVGVI